MRYLMSTLKAAGRFLAKAGLFLCFVLLTFALLTACSEKKKEKKVDDIPDNEDSWVDKINKHMSDIEKAADEEDTEEERDTYKLDLLDRLGSGSGGNKGFGTGS